INPFVGQAYEHRTFFSRLHHFMIMSDAFVVVPGGIGTLLELSLAWQLLQVRKLYNTPLILIGKMWAELVDWGRRSMLREGNELASEIDFVIPHCVNTVEECLALIRENRAAWLAAQTPTRSNEQAHRRCHWRRGLSGLKRSHSGRRQNFGQSRLGV